MAPYKSILVYIPSNTETKTGVEAGMGAQKAVSVEVEVALPSVEALRVSLANLSLLVQRKLQQVRGLTI